MQDIPYPLFYNLCFSPCGFSIMPADTHYVASVREPLGQFRAVFKQFHMETKLNLKSKADPVKYFLTNSHQWEELLDTQDYHDGVQLRNFQAWSLSYDNKESASDFIKRLEKDFKHFIRTATIKGSIDRYNIKQY